jgi:hypothetical protein
VVGPGRPFRLFWLTGRLTPWAGLSRERVGLVGGTDTGSANFFPLKPVLKRLDSLGVAPQQPARAVGVGAVIGGGDVQRAGGGAGGQLGVEVAAGARRVGEVVADVLCGVGDADGDVVIGEEPRAGDDVARRWR